MDVSIYASVITNYPSPGAASSLIPSYYHHHVWPSFWNATRNHVQDDVQNIYPEVKEVTILFSTELYLHGKVWETQNPLPANSLETPVWTCRGRLQAAVMKITGFSFNPEQTNFKLLNQNSWWMLTVLGFCSFTLSLQSEDEVLQQRYIFY